MRVKISFAIFTFVFMAGCLMRIAGAEGIGTLVEAGKNMDSAKRELAAETASFEGLKAAIDNGSARRGISREAISGQFGKPVIMNEDPVTKRERWVYKPAGSSFFEGARIYLYFDSDGNLDEIKTLK
jgi:hypothetical protein